MIYMGIKKRFSLWLRASVMLHQWYLQTLTLGRGSWPWRHYVLIIGKSAAANKALAEMATLQLPMMLHRRALVVPSGISFTPAPSFTSQHDSNNPPKSVYALINWRWLMRKREKSLGGVRGRQSSVALNGNPSTSTTNPKPQTSNPKPQTPNPKPQTPNPKPQTLSQPQTVTCTPDTWFQNLF
jgi:hypothetical protein